jgi:hypothetical protein
VVTQAPLTQVFFGSGLPAGSLQTTGAPVAPSVQGSMQLPPLQI